MATTKILKLDLDVDLQQLLTDLESAKGTKLTLTDRLNFLDTSLTTINDAVTKLQSNIPQLQSDVNDLQTKIKELGEYGNFTEHFDYDSYGNVIKQTVTGDISFIETFNYSDPSNGILSDSSKVYTDENGKTVTIKKVYTYDSNGNITDIAVTTAVK